MSFPQTMLKQSALPEEQLRVFLLLLPQDSLKEYLTHSKIYTVRKNRNKSDLIDMIITGTDKTKVTLDDDDFSFEDAERSLKGSIQPKTNLKPKPPPPVHNKPAH